MSTNHHLRHLQSTKTKKACACTEPLQCAVLVTALLPLKPLSYSLENWPWEKKAHCGYTRLPGIFFFSKAPSFNVHVYTRSGGWHTDLSLGWRPAAGAALAARPWETGGRHPNVITAAKLLSIKAKLQKYVPWGLPTMKTELRLSGCYPRSTVEVVLRYVSWDLLWARNSRFHSCWQTSGCTCGWLCGNSYWVSLAIIVPCYCSSSPMPSECPLHILYEGGHSWQLATLCRHLSQWHGCFDSQ